MYTHCTTSVAGLTAICCAPLLFALIPSTSDSPFGGADHLQTYKKILFARLSFPPTVSKPAADLIRRLLERDITKRFGLLRGGILDIKQHPFMATFDFKRAARAGPSWTSTAPAPMQVEHSPAIRDLVNGLTKWISMPEYLGNLQARKHSPESGQAAAGRENAEQQVLLHRPPGNSIFEGF